MKKSHFAKPALRIFNWMMGIMIFSLVASACMERSPSGLIMPTPLPPPRPTATPYPGRPVYQPGELVDYLAQPGDTLPVLAIHFNTTLEKIRAANPILPAEVTTLPPGMPMKIPIYYRPLWGPSYQIIPDSLFVDGPAQSGFDLAGFIQQHDGWLKDYREYSFDGDHSSAEIIDYIAITYSISPRLLLALLDYQAGGLSLSVQPGGSLDYPLGYRESGHRGLYMQLSWAANLLNNEYYSWREGLLTQIEHLDGRVEFPDPWQNAATVALQFYFSRQYSYDVYLGMVGPDGLARTYKDLFGDPWAKVAPHIPGSLTQPELRLPFQANKVWSFTGGPHTGWGDGEPYSALDFAPPSTASGCTSTDQWATAVADGTVVRNDTGVAVLDLDGDGDERTGWVIFYLHLATDGLARAGTKLKAGDPIGHPSCEGGHATGTHVHIARKYNGEWIQADGLLAFNLEGWVAYSGPEPYEGFLRRGVDIITACTCSNQSSMLASGY